MACLKRERRKWVRCGGMVAAMTWLCLKKKPRENLSNCKLNFQLDQLAGQTCSAMHSFLPLAWADSEPVSPDSTLRSRSPCSAPGGRGLQWLVGEHGQSRRRCAGCFSGWLHFHFLWQWQTRACKNLGFQFLLSVAKLLQFPEFYFHHSSCKACWKLLPLVCHASDENCVAE